MGVDHSFCYRQGTIKNLPHRCRLRTIVSILENEVNLAGKTFADVGCSNGFITSIIWEKFKPARACGFDCDHSNLEKARGNYPFIEFSFLDLNKLCSFGQTYDIVTCFETLEHVGHLENALCNLLNLTNWKNGFLLISVPIETGFLGFAKFLFKTIVYRYSLDELPDGKHLSMRYTLNLLTRKRMSRFRDQRGSWGTHFGFDHRDMEDYLKSHNTDFKVISRLSTRFYMLNF